MSRLNLPKDILSHLEKMHNEEDNLFDNLTYGEYKMKSKSPMKKSMKDNDMDDRMDRSDKKPAKSNNMSEKMNDPTYGKPNKDSVRKSIKQGY